MKYYTGDKIKEDEIAGHVACIGQVRNAWSILLRKPEGKRSLGRPRCRWEDDMRMDFKEMCWQYVDWIDLAQYRDHWWGLVNMMNPWVS